MTRIPRPGRTLDDEYAELAADYMLAVEVIHAALERVEVEDCDEAEAILRDGIAKLDEGD